MKTTIEKVQQQLKNLLLIYTSSFVFGIFLAIVLSFGCSSEHELPASNLDEETKAETPENFTITFAINSRTFTVAGADGVIYKIKELQSRIEVQSGELTTVPSQYLNLKTQPEFKITISMNDNIDCKIPWHIADGKTITAKCAAATPPTEKKIDPPKKPELKNYDAACTAAGGENITIAKKETSVFVEICRCGEFNLKLTDYQDVEVLKKHCAWAFQPTYGI